MDADWLQLAVIYLPLGLIGLVRWGRWLIKKFGGVFYAADQIVSAKQNVIAGTFVCKSFDMGTNVPKIYQTPSLADNLPPGLIASAPIIVVTGFAERSWQAKTLTPVMTYSPYGQ